MSFSHDAMPTDHFLRPPWSRCFRCKQVAPKLAGFPQDFSAVHFRCIDLEHNEVWVCLLMALQ